MNFRWISASDLIEMEGHPFQVEACYNDTFTNDNEERRYLATVSCLWGILSLESSNDYSLDTVMSMVVHSSGNDLIPSRMQG